MNMAEVLCKLLICKRPSILKTREGKSIISIPEVSETRARLGGDSHQVSVHEGLNVYDINYSNQQLRDFPESPDRVCVCVCLNDGEDVLIMSPRPDRRYGMKNDVRFFNTWKTKVLSINSDQTDQRQLR